MIEHERRKSAENSTITAKTEDGQQVRTVEENGEIWFVAKDVCDILEISNHRDATSNLDDDEKGVAKIDTLGGMQDMTVISEAGLYTLLLRSNKEQARPFRRWVTHEVVPSIRKHGAYMTPQTIEDMLADPDSNPFALSPDKQTQRTRGNGRAVELGKKWAAFSPDRPSKAAHWSQNP